jgi:hypothetical protein
MTYIEMSLLDDCENRTICPQEVNYEVIFITWRAWIEVSKPVRIKEMNDPLAAHCCL